MNDWKSKFKNIELQLLGSSDEILLELDKIEAFIETLLKAQVEEIMVKFQEDLDKMDGKGMRKGYVAGYATAVSSFYRYAELRKYLPKE